MKALKTCLALALAPATFGILTTLTGCATAPQTQNAKENLSDESHLAFNEMTRNDPSLPDFVNNAYAYAMFPSIGKGAAGVGGAYGRGEVYRQNKFIGYADMSQGSIGLELGGETYSELVVFQNKEALDQLMNNKMAFEAKASAVAAKSGAAKSATFVKGVVVFTMPKGGLMADASVGGQQFTFTAASTPNQ